MQRARAQSFIAFVTLGLGMFVGAKVAGWTYAHYAPDRIRERSQADSSETPFPYAPDSIAAVELLDWDIKQKSDFSTALQLKPDTALRLADEEPKTGCPNNSR